MKWREGREKKTREKEKKIGQYNKLEEMVYK